MRRKKSFDYLMLCVLILVSDWFLQTGGVAGIHLQVFGDQSRGDLVHRCSVSQKHLERFIMILFKVKHLSEEKVQKKT